MLYFAQAAPGAPIKIGHSVGPEYRIANLRSRVPGLRLLATAPGGRAEERALHARFAASQHKGRGLPCPGEWFDPSPELLALIAKGSGDAPDSIGAVASRVRSLRVALGLGSQQQFANVCGIDRLIVNRVERGKNHATSATVHAALARGFGLSEETLHEYLEGRLSLDDTIRKSGRGPWRRA